MRIGLSKLRKLARILTATESRPPLVPEEGLEPTPREDKSLARARTEFLRKTSSKHTNPPVAHLRCSCLAIVWHPTPFRVRLKIPVRSQLTACRPQSIIGFRPQRHHQLQETKP